MKKSSVGSSAQQQRQQQKSLSVSTTQGQRSASSLSALLDAVYNLFNSITLRLSPKVTQRRKSKGAVPKGVRVGKPAGAGKRKKATANKLAVK